ncbi:MULTISPECIES: FAD-dependent monooxygenase [unclassified Kribbella]|uniref:FAD-dependent monooxygenase n=1 Tax=unclassified Kribbella TaxID=2644121 RepID=UPI00301B0BDB
MSDRRAVIAGAGLGGLAAAIALHRRGWQITVLERAPALREVGAGISLWPNAVRALDLLGVGDQVRELGGIEAAAGFRDDRGRWLFRSDIVAIEELYGPSVMIRRPVLLDILKSAISADAIVLDALVDGVEAGDDQVTIEHDGVLHTADLLVGADGVRSTVRAKLWPEAKPPVYAGYTTWRFITPPLHLEVATSESWGAGERVGIIPLADGSIYSYLGASTPPGQTYADELAELRRRFGHWHDPIPAMLDSVSGTEILRHDIYRLPPLSTYVRGRVALVGDAAHAMTPDLGQGGGTALEDAVELAEALDGTDDVHEGLRRYDVRRRSRTQAIARQSRIFGAFAQSSGRPSVLLRNGIARLLPPSLLLRSLRPMLTWRG